MPAIFADREGPGRQRRDRRSTGSFSDAADVDVYRLCLSRRRLLLGDQHRRRHDARHAAVPLRLAGVRDLRERRLRRGVRGSTLPAQHRFSPRARRRILPRRSARSTATRRARRARSSRTASAGCLPGRRSATRTGSVGASRSATGPAAPPGGRALPDHAHRHASCVPPDTTAPTVDLRSPVDGAHVRAGRRRGRGLLVRGRGQLRPRLLRGHDRRRRAARHEQAGDVSVTVTARDHAGNETVVDAHRHGRGRDQPEVTIDTPADGAVYARGEHVTADYSCADEPNGSGLESCVGDVPDGGALDTSTLGEHTFTVEATDRAGNTGSKTVNYTVVDTTAPQHRGDDPGVGRGLWPRRDVAADYSCADEAGGSGLASLHGHASPTARRSTPRASARRPSRSRRPTTPATRPPRRSPTRWSTGRRPRSAGGARRRRGLRARPARARLRTRARTRRVAPVSRAARVRWPTARRSTRRASASTPSR